MKKYYRFYWLDGKEDDGIGETVSEAFTYLGYGGGTVQALDYYKEITKEEFEK